MRYVFILFFIVIGFTSFSQSVVTSAEYFLGTIDPGAGNATPMQVYDGAFDEAIESLFIDSVSIDLTNGPLLFNIRVRDAYNHWGPVFKKTLASVTATTNSTRYVNISSAEYFLGFTDPGEGNGNALLVFDGAFDEAIETIFKDSALIDASSGSFLLNVRVKDADSHWGPIFKKTFVYTPEISNTTRDIHLTDAEYFLGFTDPGEGNGTTLLVFDGAFDEAIETIFKDSLLIDASSGSFLLNVRVKDAEGHWGPVFKKAFVYIPANTNTVRDINITAAEYYLGFNDPGEGSATPLLAFDGAFDEAIETILKDSALYDVSSGSFLLNVRVKDADNHWGPVFKKAFVFSSPLANVARDINITAGEYYFGLTDPGQGNATPIIAYDGYFDEAVETLFRSSATWSVTAGPTLFNIRVRDADQHWGPVFKKVIIPNGANEIPNLIAQGDSIRLCQNTSVTLKYTGPNGYIVTWFDNSHADSLSLLPSAEGYYKVSSQSGSSLFEDSIYISFYPGLTASISASGTLVNCGTGNFELTCTTVSNATYQWRLNGNNIAGATGNSFTVIQDGAYNVQVTDSQSGCSAVSDSVNATSTPAISSTYATTPCIETYLFYAPIGTGNTYQWMNDGLPISGAIQASFETSASGTYAVEITQGNCTLASNAIQINIVPVVTASITNNGATTFCTGDSIVLYANTGSGLSYQWYRNEIAIPAATSSTWSATQSGDYTVEVFYNNCSAMSTAINVSVLRLPSAFMSASGSTVFCEGGDVVLSVMNESGLTYQWFKNMVPINGASSHEYTATQSGNYAVLVTNSNSCTALSADMPVIVNPYPTASITASGMTTFCQGGNVALNATIGVGYSYQWFKNGSIITGVTAYNYTATLSGDYQVQTMLNNLCPSLSAITHVTANPNPTVNAISNQSYCNGQTSSAIPLSGTPAGVTFDITGGAARGLPNQIGVTSIPSFIATSGSAIVTITPKANGCAGTPSTYTMTVSNCPPITLNLKFYIQGYYLGAGIMQQVLFNQGETNDPASVQTDYVVVELRSTSLPYNALKTTVGLLKTDGTLTCNFNASVINSSYYIAITHRNAIVTWSATPVTMQQTTNYNFSNAASKVYGNNQVDVSGNGSIWAFYNGDVNQDENIDLLDAPFLEADINDFLSGYFATDLNGDGNIDLLDLPLLEENTNNFIFSDHP